MKKLNSILIISSIIISCNFFTTPIVNAGPNKPKPIKFDLQCKPTKAVGHKAKNIIPPEFKSPPKSRIFKFTTNCGDVVIAADGKNAPVTVFALTALVKGGFFDQSLCHRLTNNNIYVLQCGDPTATGLGAPNFSYRDENLPGNNENNYPEGVVAMANSGPDTNGSQFFIVYKNTSLPPNYTIWGKVIEGLEIIQAIAKEGVLDNKSDGTPKLSISIEKAKVR